MPTYFPSKDFGGNVNSLNMITMGTKSSRGLGICNTVATALLSVG